jgi:hypothetical protein
MKKKDLLFTLSLLRATTVAAPVPQWRHDLVWEDVPRHIRALEEHSDDMKALVKALASAMQEEDTLEKTGRKDKEKAGESEHPPESDIT